MRRWGWEESSKLPDFSAVANDALMLNAQNIYDLLFGDLAGSIDGHFFIAEFKQNRAGFASELEEKELRKTMVAHMKDPKGADCRELGLQAHFAIYPDGIDYAVEPYFDAVDPAKKPSKVSSFKNFFTAIHEGKLGLQEYDFYRYMECVLANLFSSEKKTPAGTFLFAYLNNKGVVTFYLANTKSELKLVLALALKRLIKMQSRHTSQVNASGIK